MNRKLRSSSSSPLIEERLHRFLKPGALARIRDSRISARSPRSALMPRLSPPSPPPSSVPAQFDRLPCFVSRSGGFRYPQRKKLVASKYVYFAPPSPDLAELFLDAAAFGIDLVAAR